MVFYSCSINQDANIMNLKEFINNYSRQFGMFDTEGFKIIKTKYVFSIA